MSYKYFQCCWILYPTPHLTCYKDIITQSFFPKYFFKDEGHNIKAGLHVFNFTRFCEVLGHA